MFNIVLEIYKVIMTTYTQNNFLSNFSGQSGREIFLSTQILARGDSIHEGIYTKEVESEYKWKPVSQSIHTILNILNQYEGCILIILLQS